MMETLDLGLIGGILGAILGLIGAATGIYFSVKNTNGPAEKSFIIKFGLFVTSVFSLLFVMLFIVPANVKVYIWLLFMLLLGWAIKFGNKKQREIRAKEHNA